MEKRAAFGRRAPAQYRSAAPEMMKAAPAKPAPANDVPRSAFEAESVSPPAAPPVRHPDPVDAELEEWKRSRKKLPLFAWRPLYFMASLCFGLASFVLPDSINDIVQWPLYALAGLSFYLGMKMRRAKRAARRAEKLEAKAQDSL